MQADREVWFLCSRLWGPPPNPFHNRDGCVPVRGSHTQGKREVGGEGTVGRGGHLPSSCRLLTLGVITPSSPSSQINLSGCCRWSDSQSPPETPEELCRQEARGEAKDTALLSSRDGYILELTAWPKMSQASCGVWREDSGLLSRPYSKRRPSSREDWGVSWVFSM